MLRARRREVDIEADFFFAFWWIINVERGKDISLILCCRETRLRHAKPAYATGFQIKIKFDQFAPMSSDMKIWEHFGMTQDLFLSTVKSIKFESTMSTILNPYSDLWVQYRNRATPVPIRWSVETGYEIDDHARDHAKMAVELFNWTLGCDDPSIWISCFQQHGSTSTCNYVRSLY